MSENDYIDSILNKCIGILIKNEREKRNWTLEQLATRSGVSKQNIYYYEIGRNRVKLGKFMKICDALGLDPAQTLDIINLEYIKQTKI